MLKNKFLFTQLFIAIVITASIGYGWGLFSLVLTELIIALGYSKNKNIMLMCYYGLIMAILYWNPLAGFLGALYCFVIDVISEIYFRITLMIKRT